jgi:hypothetical protein
MTIPYNLYQVGDTVRVKAEFTQSEVPTDPDTISLQIKNPEGTTLLYSYAAAEITRDVTTTGTYYKDIFLDDLGKWMYRFQGSGTVTAADEHYLIVERTNF